MKAGIICAGDTEFEAFLKYLEKDRVTKKAMLEFHEAEIGGIPVTVLYSGVCRVNAALATQILIDRFGAEAVISAGTAGGMDESAGLFDTVVAERTAYHDVADDILTDFRPWMKSVYFEADVQLLEAAREYAQGAKERILFGTAVTGEAFIGNKEREAIRKKYAPLSVDMESAGIAHVYYVNEIPFLSVRTVTDTPEQEGIEVFEKNCERASAISAGITVGILKTFVKKAGGQHGNH